jgi:uncharacterized protein (TIGR03086 family)
MPDLVGILAEPNRRRLLELLSGGEQSVTELASRFGVTRSAISQHLGVLADAGLVTVRQAGRFRYYRLDPDGMAGLRAALDTFWTKELEQLAAARPTIGGDTVQVEKSVFVPLGADETFALLTEPERLRRWQAVTARIDLRAGGEYRWTIVPGHTAAGTITVVEPGRRLVFSWGWEESEDLRPGASTVTITLEPEAGGTRVRLVHDGLTADQAAGHGEGWQHYMDRLATAGAKGDAGLDEWAFPESFDRLGAAEASLAVCQFVLRNLRPEDATAGTPCPKFTVDDLLDHLVRSITILGGAAGTTIDAPSGGSPEARVALAAEPALEAWRRRGLEGTVTLPPGEIPAEIAVNILSVEFLVHAWDVAQASGQTIVVSDALSSYVLERARELISPQIRDGENFAAEVATGPDAGNLERLIAFTGRAA